MLDLGQPCGNVAGLPQQIAQGQSNIRIFRLQPNRLAITGHGIRQSPQGQQGIASIAVRLEHIRCMQDRLVMAGYGIREQAHGFKQDAAIDVSGDQGRIQPDRLVVAFARLIQTPQHLERICPVGMGLRIARSDPDRLDEALPSLIDALHFIKRYSQVVQGFGAFGKNGQRAPEALFCLTETALSVQDDSQVIVGFHIIAAKTYCLLKTRLRLRKMFLPVQNDTQVVMPLGLTGLDLQRSSETRRGLVEAPQFIEDDAKKSVGFAPLGRKLDCPQKAGDRTFALASLLERLRQLALPVRLGMKSGAGRQGFGACFDACGQCIDFRPLQASRSPLCQNLPCRNGIPGEQQGFDVGQPILAIARICSKRSLEPG
nr:hypothetical protein [Sterolibacterium denitrificans]